MSEHEHRWMNATTMRQARVSASPYSRSDDHLWDDVIGVQTCECGETRKLLLGYENRRRRGDDYRRAAGKEPLGIPLSPSGVYDKPKVLA